VPSRVPALALDDLLASAGVDPRHGVQIVDVEHLVSIPFDPGLPLVVLRSGAPTSAASAEISPLPGRHRETGASRLLMRL